jgi:DNA-directed RNA polymerase subunit M/transcription elongation factor TFIIS
MEEPTTQCPACGAEDYHSYQVPPGHGDPSETWCECHHCETSFYGVVPWE